MLETDLRRLLLKEWKASRDNNHLECGQIQSVLIKVKSVHQIRIESVTIKIFPAVSNIRITLNLCKAQSGQSAFKKMQFDDIPFHEVSFSLSMAHFRENRVKQVHVLFKCVDAV